MLLCGSIESMQTHLSFTRYAIKTRKIFGVQIHVWLWPKNPDMDTEREVATDFIDQGINESDFHSISTT